MMQRRMSKWLTPAVIATAGCSGGPSVFSPAGPASRDLAHLGTWVLVVLSAAGTATIALILWASARQRGSFAEHAPASTGGGLLWILVGGFLVPALVLFPIFIATLRAVDHFPLHPPSGHGRADIHLIGHQWWWEVHYLADSPDRQVTTADEIHVPIGWPVEIELESRDVIHSFWVPALHGKLDLIPGHPNRIRVLADRAGRFEGECAEYCGAGHARMLLVVVAEPLDAYEAWLAGQAAPALPPADRASETGQAIFENRACGTCHTIRGTSAMSSVGPDLTHVGGRSGLAANTLPNSRAWLEAWITHAQSIKPGSQMPDLAQLRGDELQAVATYLGSLR
jgi:cytochrome c oxidase subunit 2